MRRTKSILFIVFLASSCSQPRTADKPALKIDGSAIKAHIEKLASDEMEGRAPGGRGEELATSYISNFYKSIGLKTQLQAVPFAGITSTVSPLELITKTGKKALKYGDDFVAWRSEERRVGKECR